MGGPAGRGSGSDHLDVAGSLRTRPTHRRPWITGGSFHIAPLLIAATTTSSSRTPPSQRRFNFGGFSSKPPTPTPTRLIRITGTRSDQERVAGHGGPGRCLRLESNLRLPREGGGKGSLRAKRENRGFSGRCTEGQLDSSEPWERIKGQSPAFHWLEEPFAPDNQLIGKACCCCCCRRCLAFWWTPAHIYMD